ncbi:MAG: transposase domain-containing protein [Pseudomonadota bacterium]
MSRPEPSHAWLSAAEIAEAKLPDVPATKRKVNALAERAGWKRDGDRARKRDGRGGGWEFHYTLLPLAAQRRLQAAPKAPAPATAPKGVEVSPWQRFEAATLGARGKATSRLEALADVDRLVEAGLTKDEAVREVAADRSVSARSIWNWFKLVEGAPREDWLPLLLPGHVRGPRAAKRQEIDGDFWDAFRAHYMRQAQPSFATAFRQTAAVAAKEGWAIPPERTFQRRFFEATPKLAIVLAREGVDAVKRLYPAQRRVKSHLHALEWVNADGHRFDVMVKWPDGTIGRPQMIAFQDVYSGKFLSWNIDQTLHSMGAMMAFRDVITDYGVPDHCLFDNGREFAAKLLTGGAPTRFRFKVRSDELPGVLTALNVQVHWATPAHGQAKPIERAFRDIADSVAKHPAMGRAYTGNHPGARPEDFRGAVDLDVFEDVLAQGIAEHNARQGRRSETAAGRSFDETFAESFAAAPIRVASEEQRALCMMAADGVRAQNPNGQINLHGNTYWDHWMVEHAGRRVVARFDPADLQAGLHVYSTDGVRLGFAKCFEAVGFDSLDGAREHNRARRAYLRHVKAADEAQRRMSTAELAALMRADALADGETPPRPKVVRAMFGTGGAAAAVAAPSPQAAMSPREADEAWRNGLLRLVEERRDEE